MTQAQRTHTSANGLVPAAVAGLVMVAALAGAILVYGLPTLSLTPETGTVATNSALTHAAQDRWVQERLSQSLGTSVAAAKSAQQWEAMQQALTTSPARSSTFTEAERQAILRHQMIDPDAVSSQLNTATERVAMPTDPKIR
jgi:hypothetical protein